jgi:hypothetical protein
MAASLHGPIKLMKNEEFPNKRLLNGYSVHELVDEKNNIISNEGVVLYTCAL